MSEVKPGIITDEVMFQEMAFRPRLDGCDPEGDSGHDTGLTGNEASNDKDSFDEFMTILYELNKDSLPGYASHIRKKLDASYDRSDPIIHEPVWGSFNVRLPLEFKDGVQWIARFPVNGTKGKWDAISATALTTEAQTMVMLGNETTIPLPRVFSYSATTENELNCHFILMSLIEGLPLNRVWWGHLNGLHDEEENKQFRDRALKGVADAMNQLRRFRYSMGGALKFDPENGKVIGIGPMRMFDQHAEEERYLAEWHASKDINLRNLEFDTSAIYMEAGPFGKLEDFYNCALTKRKEPDWFGQGITRDVELLISWLPAPADEKQFNLGHPELDLQNIIVSEKGELMGIIDWDNVATVPRLMGSEGHPLWLIRDWDASSYMYTPPADGGDPRDEEDSPETLQYYRRFYRQYWGCTSYTTAEGHPFDAASVSLIARDLYLAARDPNSSDHIVRKMVAEIEDTCKSDIGYDFNLHTLANGLSNQITGDSATFGDYALDILRSSFEVLLTADF